MKLTESKYHEEIVLPFLCGMKLCENELESYMLFYLGVGSVLVELKA